ncbi:MAG: Crp/Fnr family transcriptional regulator [Clostridium sp.]|nr:Crp/Fnr family transcriptional regulator [Clostridium sp.]
MKKYLKILKYTQLFHGVQETEIEAMMNCLDARSVIFQKGEYVFRTGEYFDSVILLVDGSILIQRDDYWGNRTIINKISAGEIFGEAYLSPDSGAVPNDALAIEKSTVITFDIKRILTMCPNSCEFHVTAVKNLFFTVSEKNRQLISKIGCMSGRTIREKLTTYLSDESKRCHSSTFSIPFNRQQLADFLCVDRSAMSNELCKMRDNGLIEFHKNQFTLKRID